MKDIGLARWAIAVHLAQGISLSWLIESFGFSYEGICGKP
jgi:hypothetical protein